MLIDSFTLSLELSVYRIVQELVNNIIKHSKASQAMLQLTQQDDLLSISILVKNFNYAVNEQNVL